MAKKKTEVVEVEETEVVEVVEVEVVEVEEVEPAGGELVVGNDQTTLPAVTDDEAAFLVEQSEQDDDDSLTIPFLKVGQKDKQAGKLYSTDLDQDWESLTVVPLKTIPGCVMWPDKFNKDSVPLCKSNNGLVPDPEIEKPMCSEENCCKSVWDKKARKMVKPCAYGNWDGNTPPACQDTDTLLFVEIGEETMVPFWVQFKSTALSPWKKFRKTLNLRKRVLTTKRKRAGLPPAHMAMFKFDIVTFLKTNDAGDAWIAICENLEELPNDMAEFGVMIAMAERDRTVGVIEGGFHEEPDDGIASGELKEDF